MNLTLEEKRLYASRDNSYEDRLAWLEAKAAIKEREAKERQQDKSGTSRKDGPIIPIFKAPAGFEDLGRSKKFGHDQGIRWAPHKGKMIPLSEWNEDEYQEWRAHHYMSCYQKVQDMRDRHAQAELPNLRNISGAWK
jgi:hypothetical protein